MLLQKVLDRKHFAAVLCVITILFDSGVGEKEQQNLVNFVCVYTLNKLRGNHSTHNIESIVMSCVREEAEAAFGITPSGWHIAFIDMLGEQ